MWFIHLFRHRLSPSTLVNGLAGLSLLVVVVRNTLLVVTEPFPGVARVGTVLNSLALACLAAWIFHRIVVEIPRVQSQARVHEAVDPVVTAVATSGTRILNAMASHTGHTVEGFVSGDAVVPPYSNVEEICASINVHDKAPLVSAVDPRGNISHANWLQYLRNAADDFDRRHERLVAVYSYLDANLVALLHEMSENDLLRQARLFVNLPIGNQTLSFLTASLYTHLEQCRKVEERWVQLRENPGRLE